MFRINFALPERTSTPYYTPYAYAFKCFRKYVYSELGRGLGGAGRELSFSFNFLEEEEERTPSSQEELTLLLYF